MKDLRYYLIPAAFFLSLAPFSLRSVGQIHEKNDDEISRIIEAHAQNTDKLYITRGIRGYFRGIISLKDVQQQLAKRYPEGEIGMLIYAHLNDSLFITLVDKNGVKGLRKCRMVLDSLLSIEQKIKLSFLPKGDFVARLPQKRGARISIPATSPKNVSIPLISKQLMPFGDSLLQYGHLIIIPALNLGSLPFSLFQPFSDGSFLIDHMSYSIAPSLFEFMVLTDFRAFPEDKMEIKNALIVGNPKYPSTKDWFFPDLSGAEMEAIMVDSLLNSKSGLLIGEKATKHSFYWNGLIGPEKAPDLIYIASHGISHNSHPLDSSFLVLSGDDESAFLTAREIQNIPAERGMLRVSDYAPRAINDPLEVGLVVMSACQSGLGGTHQGGTIGLARAWQIAGANNIAMSLWSIDDQVTVSLMTSFIKNLGKPMLFQPASSLRMAIIEVREKHPGFKYWASFSIFGVPFGGW